MHFHPLLSIIDILMYVEFVCLEMHLWLTIPFWNICVYCIVFDSIHTAILIIIFWRLDTFFHSHLLDIMHASIVKFISILVLIGYFMFSVLFVSFLILQAAEKLRALPDVHYKLKDKPVNNSDQWKKPKETLFHMLMSADGYLWYMVLQYSCSIQDVQLTKNLVIVFDCLYWQITLQEKKCYILITLEIHEPKVYINIKLITLADFDETSCSLMYLWATEIIVWFTVHKFLMEL